MTNERKEGKKIDNNFTELLQEVRVSQQGIQVLFAFLLTAPFQNRFSELHAYQNWIYATALFSAALSTILFISPVSHHRILFHQGLKSVIVDFSSNLAQLALIFMVISMLASVFLVLSVIFNVVLASIFAGVGLTCVVVLWYAVPLRFRYIKNGETAE